MSKRKPLDKLTHELVENVNKDKTNYKHINFVGNDESGLKKVEGVIDVLFSDKKVIGEEKSGFKLATYSFKAMANIHNDSDFAGMRLKELKLISAKMAKDESLEECGDEEITNLHLSSYQSARVEEIIREEVSAAFCHQRPLWLTLRLNKQKAAT